MMREVQERINILENSIKVLERILKTVGYQNDSPSLSLVQNRINSYKKTYELIKLQRR